MYDHYFTIFIEEYWENRVMDNKIKVIIKIIRINKHFFLLAIL